MCGRGKFIIYRDFSICLLLILTFNFRTHAQFSMNAYLSDARNDVRMLENKLKSTFLEKNPYRSPIIHRMEFRSRTNNFDLIQDDFRLRFNPTNPFEISANKKYYEIESNSLIVNYQFELNKALHRRYNQLISMLQLEDEIIFKEREILVQQDHLRILESYLNAEEFDVSEYIKQKENLMNMIMDLNDLNHNREKILYRINSEFSFSGDLDVQDFNLITYDQIKNLMELKSGSSDTSQNIHLENLNRRALLEEQRIRVEKAEGRRNIGYIQAEYDRLRGDDFERHFGVQIGVRIPITNADKPDLNRRKLELLEDKSDMEREKSGLKVQCDLLKLDIEYLFSQQEMISEAISNDQLQQLLDQTRDLAPEDILEAQKSMLKMMKYDKMIQWDVLQSFVDYLYYSGKLVQAPLRNYLSAELDEI